MTGAAPGGVRGVTLVWIDARSAAIVRRTDGAASIERIDSEVPPRRRSVRHIRHDPRIRQGGGMAQDRGESHRLEHLTRFVEQVTAVLPADDDLIILGSGIVRHVLERQVRDLDDGRAAARSVTGSAARRLTEPQLIARLLELNDARPPRGRRVDC